MTYAETLAWPEAVASPPRRRLGVRRPGHDPGAELLRSWSLPGSVPRVGGLVEVPINTAYEYDFLAHRIRTADPPSPSSTTDMHIVSSPSLSAPVCNASM